jgi:hypothetical protein
VHIQQAGVVSADAQRFIEVDTLEPSTTDVTVLLGARALVLRLLALGTVDELREPG